MVNRVPLKDGALNFFTKDGVRNTPIGFIQVEYRFAVHISGNLRACTSLIDSSTCRSSVLVILFVGHGHDVGVGVVVGFCLVATLADVIFSVVGVVDIFKQLVVVPVFFPVPVFLFFVIDVRIVRVAVVVGSLCARVWFFRRVQLTTTWDCVAYESRRICRMDAALAVTDFEFKWNVALRKSIYVRPMRSAQPGNMVGPATMVDFLVFNSNMTSPIHYG